MWLPGIKLGPLASVGKHSRLSYQGMVSGALGTNEKVSFSPAGSFSITDPLFSNPYCKKWPIIEVLSQKNPFNGNSPKLTRSRTFLSLVVATSQHPNDAAKQVELVRVFVFVFEVKGPALKRNRFSLLWGSMLICRWNGILEQNSVGLGRWDR